MSIASLARRHFIGAVVIAATASVAAPAFAQSTWPDRPVRLVVPVGAGGAADTLARNLSNGFQAGRERAAADCREPPGRRRNDGCDGRRA